MGDRLKRMWRMTLDCLLKGLAIGFLYVVLEVASAMFGLGPTTIVVAVFTVACLWVSAGEGDND